MASKRGQKRRGKKMNEETLESPQNVSKDLQAVENVEEHIGEDQRELSSEMSGEDNISLTKTLLCSEEISSQKLQQKNKRLRKKIKKMEEEIKILKKSMRSRIGKSRKHRTHVDDSDDSSSSSTSSSASSSSLSSLSSTSSSTLRKPKTSENRKKKKKHSHPLAMARACTTDDVVHRYQKVLKAYKSNGSMTKAFKFVGVDRNTLALSAPLAEISIACPKFLKSLPPFNMKKEKLLEYSKHCAESMTPEVRTKIDELKAIGKLLPIKYKYR